MINKSNKKGFTLVELLVVIALIALLIAIAIPSGFAISKKIKQKMLDTKIEQIESSAIVWGQSNKTAIKNGANCESEEILNDENVTACVRMTISDLINERIIEADDEIENEDGSKTKVLLNPTNNESLNNCGVEIYIKNKRVYAKYDINGTNCYSSNNTDNDDGSSGGEGSVLVQDIKLYNSDEAIESINVSNTSYIFTILYNLSLDVLPENSTNKKLEISIENPDVADIRDLSDCLDGKCIYENGKFGMDFTTASAKTNLIVKTTDGSNIVKKFPIIVNEGMLFSQLILGHNAIESPKTEVGTASSSDESILASAEDNYGTTYYFRGNVENNYVNFAGMCWRIVRIQGDNSVKLVLDNQSQECDAEGYSQDFVIETSNYVVYNGEGLYDGNGAYYYYYYALFNGSEANGYVGVGPSLMNWISNKLTSSEQETYLKSEDNALYDFTKNPNRTKEIAYTDYYIYDNPMSSSFSVSFKRMTESVGKFMLLSADEIIYAGSPRNGINKNFYLYSNQELITISPEGYSCYTNRDYGEYGGGCSDNIIYFGATGLFVPYTYDLGYVAGIRPVIVLKSDIKAYGYGYKNDPYIII